MGYQFIHVEAYGRKAAKGKMSAGSVVAEATRRPDACPHVAHPQAPTQIEGPDLAEWWQELEAEADSATTVTASGQVRRLRADRPILTAAVASWPVPVADLDDAGREELDRWVELNLTWLRAEFGDRLGPVIMHTDEEYPHLHAYARPDRVEHDQGYELLSSHPGHRAERDPELKRSRKAGYIDAMRQVQDSYYEAVGQPCGLARIGPGRRRLSRQAWRQEQLQAAALTDARAAADDERDWARIEHEHWLHLAKSEITSERNRIREELRGLASIVEAKQEAMNARMHDLDEREKHITDIENDAANAWALVEQYEDLYGPLPGAESAPE